ncbi:MAG: acetyltransferase [Cellvibrionaceae bacterium]|jgi:acetyltransferase
MTTLNQGTSHDFWNFKRRPLDAIFRPEKIAIIGATEREGSVGRTITQNLLEGSWTGKLYMVNPGRWRVFGEKTYKNIEEIPDEVDLAVIVVPAQYVTQVVQECVDAHIPGAIIISAGFKEIGEAGVALEQEILKIARTGNLRIIGPNCLGVMNPLTGMNATFASKMARPGNVGFISQSGAMCTAILDWSMTENVGFSAFVSIGSMLDVDWGDIITWLGDDPKTKSIVIYMESVGDARSFLSAAREVALTKPIIIIKPGRTAAAAQAAASHTGSLTGSDEVLDIAFRRVGALRVDHIFELFYMAELLSKQPRSRGPKLTIITNAGGPGVLATDALLGSGGQLSQLSDEVVEQLNDILPAHWSHANPIDILGDATPDTYVKALEIATTNKDSDGFLVVLSPQAMTDPTRTAQGLVDYVKAQKGNRPFLTSWMGGNDVRGGKDILNQAGIPTFNYPDTAARMFGYMWRYAQNLQKVYETPRWQGDFEPDRELVAEMISSIRVTGRTILTEFESKTMLAAYGIHTVPTHLAKTADDAVAKAEQIGFPVVVKLNSETVTHKTDVGGVQLNLKSSAEVRHAFELIELNVGEKFSPDDFLGVTVQPMVDLHDTYELILGATPDPQFGPILLFGTGGTLVEVYRDNALELPPLNSNLARRMMARTKIYEALQGVRGRDPVDLAALETLMIRFSYLVSEHRFIREIDINPLLASADQLIALDGRVILYPPEVVDVQEPAIRPYPSQYEMTFETKAGRMVEMRPIRPEDEPLMVEFHRDLSSESVYMRYFSALGFNTRVAHSRLIRVCHVDYDQDIALVVTNENEAGEDEIIAAGRLTKEHGHNSAEYAILVADLWHGQGIGSKLLKQLIEVGKQEKLDRIVAYILPNNGGMRKVSERLGFKFKMEDGVYFAILDLTEPTISIKK